ncbi:NAD(P)H-binding protein [Kibdelosporangium lantanae]
MEKVYLYTLRSGVDSFLAAARAAGVRQVVLLSALAAGDDDPDNAIAQMHLRVERAVASSGISWTFLRPGPFAANTLHWATSIKDSGGVRIPYAQAQNASIHELDIAEVSVAALLEDGHAGATYVLTGPESLTQERHVSLISEAIGKSLWVEDLTGDDARAALTEAFRSPELVDTRIRYYEQTLSRPDFVSDTTEKVLGRPGRTFAQWAQDHRADFR